MGASGGRELGPYRHFPRWSVERHALENCTITRACSRRAGIRAAVE